MVFIHFSISVHTMSLTILFNKRTVPFLKDFEATIFPSEKIENSVLPPPTSTYKKVLSVFINCFKSEEAIIDASFLPSIISILISAFFLIRANISSLL